MTDQVVILCDGYPLSPRDVYLAIQATGYTFCQLYWKGGCQEQAKLEMFLEGQAGILVTRDYLFSGMEAGTVVCIGGGYSGYRSCLLRAVGKLIIIPTRELDQEYLELFEVVKVET